MSRQRNLDTSCVRTGGSKILLPDGRRIVFTTSNFCTNNMKFQRNAAKFSFFFRNFLQHNQREQGAAENNSKDLLQISNVILPYSHIRMLGDIGLCSNLTICILNNNFIPEIDSLASCKGLQKLDVHSNQVFFVAWKNLSKSVPELLIFICICSILHQLVIQGLHHELSDCVTACFILLDQSAMPRVLVSP